MPRRRRRRRLTTGISLRSLPPGNSPAYAAQHGTTNNLAISNSSTLRLSVGASIIWDSPVRALRADYFYVLSKTASDKTQAFGFGNSGW